MKNEKLIVNNNIDVSIIIVSYNCKDYLTDCLRTVRRDIEGSGLKTEVIVVEVSSNDETVEMLKNKEYGWLSYVKAENRGFGAGNNVGMKVAKGKYLFLLNPDTVVEKGTIRFLYDYLEKNNWVGLVGPKLKFGDGNLQISAYDNYPGIISAFLENTLLDRLFYKLFPNTIYPGKLFSRKLHDRKREVAHLLGAAMFMRREIYEQTMGFYEQFFMFREETGWQYRMKLAGWKIVFNPEITVTHFEGGSTGEARRKKNWQRKLDMYLPSVYKYEKKWGGWLRAILVGLIYFFGSIWTLLILGIIWPINNIFGWVVNNCRKKINRSIADIAIYHWAIIIWHVRYLDRWF